MAETYLGNPNLKAVGQNVEWTEESIKEYKKCWEDPEHFIQNYVSVVHVDKGLISFDMYPYEKKMINTFIKCLDRQVNQQQSFPSFYITYCSTRV